MNNPLVSICIPTYNGSAFLAQCIESATKQTYSNIEILAIDDKSSDDTCLLIEKYAATDTRIKLIRNEQNLGLVGNWNKCIDIAKGEWIKFLFQDDYFDVNCIKVMVENISDTDRIVTSGRNMVFEDSLDEAAKKYSINETLTFPKLGIHAEKPIAITAKQVSDFAANNICMNFIGEPTVVMFRKDVAQEVGYVNPDMIQICDLEYFLRIATTYGIKYIPQPLTYFRAGAHKGSTSSANRSKKLFSLIHIDPIITTHQLLYAPLFKSFREAISAKQKNKLSLYFRTHVYEAQQAALKAGNEERDIFEQVSNKYPEIKNYRNGSFFTKIILFFIKLKRASA
jgi:glycosyltransferase involved in cell wall biosynthesis